MLLNSNDLFIFVVKHHRIHLNQKTIVYMSFQVLVTVDNFFFLVHSYKYIYVHVYTVKRVLSFGKKKL